MERPIVNLDELEYEPWDSGFTNTSRPPERYGARRALIGKRLGARKLGVSTMELTNVIEYPDSGKVGYGVVSVQPDGNRELLRGIVRRGGRLL